MASNINENELTFIRRVSNRLRDQGVEPRPIDSQCSALRDKYCPTEQAQSVPAQYNEQSVSAR